MVRNDCFDGGNIKEVCIKVKIFPSCFFCRVPFIVVILKKICIINP